MCQQKAQLWVLMSPFQINSGQWNTELSKVIKSGSLTMMIPAERRRRILSRTRTDGVVSTQELAEQLDVSELTVRRDLKVMADEGLLVRTRGGASMRGSLAQELTYLEKTAEAHREKVAIAARAAELVESGDSVILGPGTSTLELANQIKQVSDLTVVTNSLLVIDALMSVSNVQVEVTAGSLRRSIRALVGPLTEESLRTLKVNKVFISGNGVTRERGLTTPEVTVASSDRALVAAGEKRIVLADHTKIGKDTMWQTMSVDQMDVLVTDQQAPVDDLDALRNAGVEVIIAREA
jgi:DeoR/GlpR family transcriptional regulator of sugar metabolism